MNKKDIRNIVIICLIFIFYVFYTYLSGYVYISEVDFISQHFRISQYLRDLFYNTFDFFNNFAFNLGAGQNIFYLSYHSLYSPILLISYLFPFIEMSTYVIISNIILVVLSIIFFYYFLKNKFNTNITTISTFIFAMAGPLIYHTHRHIMFNNYMLFLILALICVDKYFDNKDKRGLIISIFLIILTSYFYSVGAIFTICLYALFKYLKTVKKLTFKSFIKEMFKFILTIFVPIIMCAFFLLPTLYTILNGRGMDNNNVDILSLFIPNFNIDNFMYQSYSVGLSSILIFSIIDNLLSNKKENKVISIISIIILIFPIVCYAFNGFLYVDGKCFIPLLPLFCFLIANSLNNITSKNYNINKLLLISSIVILIIILSNLTYKYLAIFIIDFLIVILAFILYKKKNNILFISIPIIIFSIICAFIINNNDTLVTRNKFNDINSINNSINIDYDDNYRSGNLFYILENVNNVLDNNYYSTSIYSSTSNNYYTNFIRNVFKNEVYNKDYHTLTQSSNVLFNMYMGVKYLISPYNVIGYNKIDDNLYQNNDVFSIGYASSNLMSLEEFNSLSYPYTLDALMNYIIVDKDLDYVYENNNIKTYNNFVNLFENLDYEYIDDNYVFDIKQNTNTKLKLDDSIKNKIIIISFDMNYNDNIDTSITINNVKNTLSYKNWKYHNNNYTFHYVISDNVLDIDITPGHYEISNLNIYFMDYDSYKNINNTHDKFYFTYDSNNILGNINVSNDGYFTLSIPYDLGFDIKLDGKKIDYELVNTSFIGFNINKGYHEIDISYNAPYFRSGLIISLIGAIIYVIIFWRFKHEKN